MTQSPQVWQQGAQTLCCIERRQETADAVTLVFRPLQALAVSYQPGQFLLLTVEIDGQSHSRAYSLSSSPSRSAYLAVTVKRVAGGLVSNWLLDHFHTGDTLSALAPTGAFFLPADYSAGKILLCSAGSGITPMMSMAHWLLDNQRETEILFLHSARHAEDIIFRDELMALAAKYPQFKLSLILDNTTDAFVCYQGFLNPVLFDQLVPDLSDCHAFMCGPTPYMDSLESCLRDRQFPMHNSHKESFTPAVPLNTTTEAESQFRLEVPGFGASSEITNQQTVLEALEALQLPIIGACRSGICGSCKCKVVSGSVEDISTQPGPLTEEEQQQGYILACSSRASSDLELEL
ncbi:oxidoreductase FAD/NAD(P)-binding domain protein [Tolumonas auensis DSM 9187]|uniref:Oxidoreductase FAD/NAD(P)-binding domain protein n=1 Tax=Tolumonas auensis (strain DSM 9187 / NBRC 110442 / TA 4) TaxID=595494 RepID=C4LA03_TOLAT|nr:hybrid-cluster NAD(P)-dependent oxidoreductase [Tolumonas auensis]ACQ92132.1 oxidoreductase FAD/NAD(P)-binding domain protein [Tolumonas auensis DSM 9187]